jgi:aspartate/methionine/tyrosine aminotransferase
MLDIEPFHVMDLLARARQLEAAGRSIIHMEVGEPDFTTPAPVVEAAIEALRNGQTHYTPALGLPALREVIAEQYRQRYGIDLAAKRVVITPGASGALLLALGVLVDPGGQVLMADPGYPCNRHFVRMFEGEAVTIPVGHESGYQLDEGMIRRYWSQKTVAALLATPSNPTGTMITPAALQAILAAVAGQGGYTLVDEIYLDLTYDDDEAAATSTALAYSDDIFVINSFSKYFGMTGWRLGWLVVPEAFVDAVDHLAQNIFLAASTPAQQAALAAFEPTTLAILEDRRRQFQRRRDFLLPALRDIGFSIPLTPQGAFYLYADCSRFTADSYAFARNLLDEAGVALTPGRDFGDFRATQHVRFAYTTAMDRLEEGVDRLRNYLPN